jgi:DNA repair protein RecO (recombination protein O)
MNPVSFDAVVLDTVDYGESDLIVTLFSREAGKIPVIAPHARKSKRRFRGCFEPFSRINVHVNVKSSRKIQTAVQAELIEPHAGIRKSLCKLAAAHYFLESISALFKEGISDPDVFSVINGTLANLSKENGCADTEIISLVVRGIVKIVKRAGHLPSFSICSSCRHDLADRENSHAFLLHDGSAVCVQCSHGKKGIRISQESLGILNLFFREDSGEQKLSMNPLISRQLIEITEEIIKIITQRELRSLLFLKDVMKWK